MTGVEILTTAFGLSGVVLLGLALLASYIWTPTHVRCIDCVAAGGRVWRRCGSRGSRETWCPDCGTWRVWYARFSPPTDFMAKLNRRP